MPNKPIHEGNIVNYLSLVTDSLRITAEQMHKSFITAELCNPEVVSEFNKACSAVEAALSSVEKSNKAIRKVTKT
jgi:hypothetical protein